MPLTFESPDAHICAFQPLLLEETRAMLAQSAEEAQRDLQVQLAPQSASHGNTRSYNPLSSLVGEARFGGGGGGRGGGRGGGQGNKHRTCWSLLKLSERAMSDEFLMLSFYTARTTVRVA